MTRTVPSPAFEASGNTVASALWNSGPKAMGDFYLSPPMFRGHQSVAQAVATNTYVAMKIDVTDIDTDNGHSNVTNNTRYTCQVAGWYYVEGFVALTNTAGAQDVLRTFMSLNASGGLPNQVFSLDQQLVKPANDYAAVYGSGMLKMAVGDYLEIYGIHGAGTTINTAPNVDLCPAMNVVWMHI